MKWLLLGLVLLFVTVVIYFFNRRKDVFTNGQINIGNQLCVYFYDMGMAWNKDKPFSCKPDSGDFYKYLPTYLEPPKDFRKFSDDFLPHVFSWEIMTDKTLEFWKIMKPYANKILNEALEKSGLKMEQKLPVIHFRCSDEPFSGGLVHHLQKYEFYRNALKGYEECDLITCSDFLSDENKKNACKSYTNYIKEELLPVKVNIKLCAGSILEDFAKMFYAPLTISGGSSMSFTAGYLGNGTYKEGVSRECVKGKIPEHLIKSGYCEGLSEKNRSKIYEGEIDYTLYHEDVKDYYDTETVRKQLQ